MYFDNEDNTFCEKRYATFINAIVSEAIRNKIMQYYV